MCDLKGCDIAVFLRKTQPLCEVDLLGFTALGALRESFPEATVSEGEPLPSLLFASGNRFACVIDACYPFFQREQLFSLLEYLVLSGERSVRFRAGALIGAGEDRPIASLPYKHVSCGEAFSAATFSQYYEYFRRLNVQALINSGALVYQPHTVVADRHTVAEAGARILPYVTLIRTRLSGSCAVEDSALFDCDVGEGSSVLSSRLMGVSVGANVTVGPFAYLRKGTVLQNGSHVGAFCEMKQAELGEGSKVAHLSYVGDALLGKGCNVGCGAVFANYNGSVKARTVVGDRVFIGCNSNLVAPLSVGSCSYVAAGSTVTKDISEGSLVIARSRQAEKTHWAENPFVGK